MTDFVSYTEIVRHPLTLSLITSIIVLFPLMRIYRRVGLNGAYALLIFVSLLVPGLGLLLVLLPLLFKPWPHFPAPPKAEKPVKVPL